MSIYSGKCDFADTLEIQSNGREENIDFSCYDIRIYGKDGRCHKLEINSYKDAVKYLPYLECMGGYSDGKHSIILSSIDYITEEEQEHLNWKLNDIKKAYRKLKRNKQEITKENIVANVWFGSSDDTDKLIDRVVELGEKANIEDIHLPLADYYRLRWYEEMLRVGYDEFEAWNWVYGWRRIDEDNRE